MGERPDEEDGGGFLSRWSRRKRAVDQEVAPETEEPLFDDVDVSALAEAEAETEELDEEAEANRLAAEAVDIDALQYEDDFKLFFKRGVPAALKKKALRQLWRSNPVLANIDGLNDYDENFADPTQNVYASLWQAGRGFLSEAEQKAQYASGRLEPETDDVPADDDEPLASEADAKTDETVETTEQAGEHAGGEAEAEKTVPVAEQAEEPGEDAAPARVSLRRRLQG